MSIEKHGKNQPRVSEDWSEDFDMGPLSPPDDYPVTERSRWGLVLGVLLYLSGWSITAVWVLVNHPEQMSGLTALVGVFVAPVLPLLGAAAAYYFREKAHKRKSY
jgi:hypothetical protein